MQSTETTHKSGTLSIARLPEDTLLIRIAGEWKLSVTLPSAELVLDQMVMEPVVRKITFDTEELEGFGSGLLTFLTKVSERCTQSGILVDTDGLPQGVQRLLSLASAVPERKGARREGKRVAFLARVGEAALDFRRSATDILAFIGEATVAFVRMLTGRARFRTRDFFLTVQESGAQALPIVALISLLVGLILAFVGAIQLRMFGAQIYVADAVGIGMVRVMGAIMTGIIMAGRTGAAFAAQLGTMQANEEIDALQTLGISPMEYLVLPRMLALMLMMPLLCIYADLSGILGGFIVGVGMLDITPTQYLNQTKEAVNLTNVCIGLFHGTVFGVIVALSGCLRGMQCGRSAAAVGEATTSAVVTAIVGIIVATAIITFSCEMLGI
jgi:phospholipid/cholesterol/gamma-HCH transport system permease protein